MATKDWKKNIIQDSPTRYWVDFYTSKRDSVEMTIQSLENRKKYRVYIYGGKEVKERTFKTKSQAMRFARAYMRRN